jgi:hypothetical protein
MFFPMGPALMRLLPGKSFKNLYYRAGTIRSCIILTKPNTRLMGNVGRVDL